MYATNKKFESEKNIKALAYTLGVCALLFIIFLFNYLPLPTMPLPIADEGVEVNLGNSDVGSGDVQPQAIGEPANEPPQPTTTSQTTPTNNETVDEKGDEEIEKITKPVEIKKPEIKDVKSNTKPTTVITTKPTEVKNPKAVFGPHKSNTKGNNSSVDNGFNNQGNDKTGNGDKGNPNGNPNSDSYKGNSSSGKNGLSIKSGLSGRRIAGYPTLRDEFNENAKVAVDVTVDANGKVLIASINPRGTTTTNATTRNIAIKKAYEIKFNNGKDEDFGTIVFDFKIQ